MNGARLRHGILPAMPPPVLPLHELPLDHAYATLGDGYHARVSPSPLPEARLLHFNTEAAALIGTSAASTN